MHISDGILTAPVVLGGFVATAVLLAFTSRHMESTDIPKLAVISAAFFVADLVHVPLGPASVHLILNGLAGVILGKRAFPALCPSIILQSLLFQHGGITTIGVNCLMLGGGALASYLIWNCRHAFHFRNNAYLFGALAGASAVFFSGTIFALAMLFSGEAFWLSAIQVMVVHAIIMLLEGIVVGSCAGYLQQTKPEILAGYRPPLPSTPKLRTSA